MKFAVIPLLILVGILLLVYTPISFWRGFGTDVRLSRWPDANNQQDYNAYFFIKSGRINLGYLQDFSNAKFGTSKPEFDFYADVFLVQDSILDSIRYEDWFIFWSAWNGSPNRDNPNSVSAYYYRVVAPCPLVGLVLIAVGLPWVWPTFKAMRRLRTQTNLCLHCGYNLTGVESDTCPECGAARPMATVSSSA